MNKISLKSFLATFFLSTVTTVQVINLYPNSQVNLWFSALIGAAASLPIVLVYGAISVLCPTEGLFGAAERVFGKAMGKFLSLIYTIYAILIAAVTLRYLTEFIQVVSLHRTPQWLMLLLFGAICGYVAAKGNGITARLSEFILPVAVGIFIFILICSADFYDVSNVVPGLDESVKTFAESAFSISSFSFCEAVFFLELLKDTDATPKKTYLVLTSGTVLSALYTSLLLLSDRLILGNSGSILYFPHYEAVSVINIGDFITHIEVISIISFLLCVIIKNSVCLFASTEGMKKLFPKPQRRLFTFLTTAAATVTGLIIFDSTADIYSFHRINGYLVIILQVMIPFAIFIGALVKRATHAKIPEN